MYPAHKVAALVAVLVEKGVPAEDVLAGSGITESRLRAPATRVSYKQTLAVFATRCGFRPTPRWRCWLGSACTSLRTACTATRC